MIEKLIALAKQAGFSGVRTVWLDVKTSRQTMHNRTYDELARFAEQVRKEEREACAQACETLAGPVELYNQGYHHYLDCAAAIRARGTE